jgi:hypothetical protein
MGGICGIQPDKEAVDNLLFFVDKPSLSSPQAAVDNCKADSLYMRVRKGNTHPYMRVKSLYKRFYPHIPTPYYYNESI